MNTIAVNVTAHRNVVNAVRAATHDHESFAAVLNALTDCESGHVSVAETADDIYSAAKVMLTGSESYTEHRIAMCYMTVARALELEHQS